MAKIQIIILKLHITTLLTQSYPTQNSNMANRVPPGPSGAVTSDNLRSEKKIKAENLAQAPGSVNSSGPRQVRVQCVAPYKEAAWIPIGREQEGVAPNSVQYSQGLRPPGHLTSFLRIASKASKGVTDSADNAMVFVVMRGEVTVVLNTSQFMATRGDTIHIPPHNTYNLLNSGRDEAELFIVQDVQYRSVISRI